VAAHALAGEAGGLSGEPLGSLALESLRRAHARLKGRIPIVAAGGVMTAEDAYARIRAGATLVQAYTGYIYGGPLFVRDVLRGLEGALRRDGFSSVSEAIGTDSRAGPVA
jgi:dihydroorotate dehydrogenase